MVCLLAERYALDTADPVLEPDSSHEIEPGAEFHLELADATAGLECLPASVVLFARHRRAVWANRAAADRLAAPAGWTPILARAMLDGAYAWGRTPAWITWIRSVSDLLDDGGPWPREILIPSGAGSGRWLASRLADDHKSVLGILLTYL